MPLPDKDTLIAASRRIGPHIHRTPLVSSAAISSICGGALYFKCENLQKAGAFKSRGACNAVFSLDEKQIEKGVCTHSSGNHAQALARAASLRRADAFIVMPETSPQVKVNGVRSYGGKITFCKPTLESRESTLKAIMGSNGAFEVHPYNNHTVIAGQATCAMEIFEEINDLDILLVPVGGGGLLSGSVLARNYFSPSTKVIAAEPEMANDAWRSFHEGRFIPSDNPQTIADGLLTSLGSLTWPIIRDHVDDIVTVSEEGIIRAMRTVWERMKLVIEPSAAVPLAAVIEGKVKAEGKKTGIILSGGNVDLDSLPWQKKKG
jgi:threonine dehydratase